jgi:hypothetical protein
MQNLFLKLRIRSKIIKALKSVFAALALLLIFGIFLLPDFGIHSKKLALSITNNNQKTIDISNTVSKPEFYGISSDGKKYIIKALEGIETQSGIVELKQIDMLLKNNENIGKNDSSKNGQPILISTNQPILEKLFKLKADKATWQKSNNHIYLYNNISIEYKDLYNLLLKVLIVDFKSSTAISDQIVTLNSHNFKLGSTGLKFIGKDNKALFYKPKVVLYE